MCVDDKYLCACTVHTHTYQDACMHLVCVHVSDSLRLARGIFLNHSLSHVLGQVSSTEPGAP